MDDLRDKCPNQSIRKAFANGELSDAMAQTVAQHVSQCSWCAEEIDRSCLSSSFGSSMFSEQESLDKVEQLVDSVTSRQRIDRSSVGAEYLPSGSGPGNSLYIGRYRILETIGRGSFGVVRVGIHPVLKKKVAVKISHAAYRSSSRKVLFLREAEAAAQLDHPNLVRVIDADELPDQRCYIVFEYVNGKNLKELVDQRELHLGQSLAIFRGILSGIQHAHQRGVVHRDLKLSNILVDADMQPKVTDFGLALMMNHQSTSVKQGGTRGYMAPEQENGEVNRIDARTDIFALGILLAKMVAAEPLALGQGEPMQDFAATLTDAGVPSELIKICQKCCMRRPKDRYQTIEELKEDISQLPQRSTKKKNPLAKLTSIGLQPFQAEHRLIYREWIAIGRFGGELSTSIRNWQTRIERFGFEPSFSVGLISGVAGSGKTSLIDAAILPGLSKEIDVRKFDCKIDSSASMEDFLMHFAPESDFDDSGKKTLVVLDHFSVSRFSNFEVLCRALRRVDGNNLQCLLVVNHSDLADTLELFDELEIAVDPMENYFRMPALDVKSAKSILMQSGVVNRCIPDFGTVAQSCVEQIVDKMDAEGELNLPTLHLFLFNYGKTVWDQAFALGLDSVDDWRCHYAKTQLFDFHHKLLLPVLTQVAEQSGEIDFQQLSTDLSDRKVLTEIQPLLSQTTPRFIVESPNHDADRKVFLLAHDYIRPVVTAFVQHADRFGVRQHDRWYLMHRHAERWAATGLRSELLPLRQALPVFLSAWSWKLTRTEKRFLRRSILVSLTKVSHILLLLTLCLMLFMGYRQSVNHQIVYDVLAHEDLATESVPEGWYHRSATHQLVDVANDKDDTITRRSSAVSSLLNTQSFPNEAFADLIVRANLEQQDSLFTIGSRQANRSELISVLRGFRSEPDATEHTELVLALHELNLGDNNRFESLLDRTSSFGDYLHLVAEIHKKVPMIWIVRLCSISDLSIQTRSILLDSIDEELVRNQRNDSEIQQLVGKAISYAREEQDQRLLACAYRVADLIDIEPLQLLPDWTDGPDHVGFVNTVGVTMLELPLENSGGQKLYASATELQYRHVRHFLAADSDVPHSLCYHDFFRIERLPATSVTAPSAMEFCNYLSRLEDRKPYYTRVEKVIETVGKMEAKFNRSLYVGDPESDGYRLLTGDEWQSLIDLSVGWEVESVAEDDIDLFANCDYTNREIRAFGRSRPMEKGFFDVFGNSDELCDADGMGQRFVHRGGMFMSTLEQGMECRVLERPNDRAWFVGVRICCPAPK